MSHGEICRSKSTDGERGARKGKTEKRAKIECEMAVGERKSRVEVQLETVSPPHRPASQITEWLFLTDFERELDSLGRPCVGLVLKDKDDIRCPS